MTTVSELISELQRFDGNKKVVLVAEHERSSVDHDDFDLNHTHESQCELKYDCTVSDELAESEKENEKYYKKLETINDIAERMMRDWPYMKDKERNELFTQLCEASNV